MKLGEALNIRVTVARWLGRAGRLIESLAIMVMRPDDLVELGRRTYKSPQTVGRFSMASMKLPILTDDENAMLRLLPGGPGELLLLGIGGGREVSPLTGLGYQITGVDFVQEMLDEARRAASRQGVKIRCLLQEMSKLDVPPEHFDVVWISHAMYSSVPTSKRRKEMLKRIWGGLKPGGLVVIGFVWDKNREPRPSAQMIRKAFAIITRGNLTYEPGDGLWAYSEFIHFFRSEQEVISELEYAGFEPVTMVTKSDSVFGYGAFRKRDDV